jgi:hypothetical protein
MVQLLPLLLTSAGVPIACLEEVEQMKRVFFATGLAAVLATAAACGGGSSSPSGTGSLSLALKDSPYSDAKSLVVTFTDVSVHKDDQAEDTWTKLPFSDGASSRSCDLKKLVTAQDVLGVGTLPAGHYTQIRLTVSTATIYLDNAVAGPACAASLPAPNPTGATASVDIPSGVVKLIRDITVPSGGSASILVDFDGDKSVNVTGNGRYMMAPVISVVSVS